MGPSQGASASGQNTAGAYASRMSILLTLLHALHLHPGIHRQSGNTFLHATTIQPWHVVPSSRANLMVAETVPGCSSQGHQHWPKLVLIVTSGLSWHSNISPWRRSLVLLQDPRNGQFCSCPLPVEAIILRDPRGLGTLPKLRLGFPRHSCFTPKQETPLLPYTLRRRRKTTF